MRILLLLISLLSFSFCNQEDWRKQMEAENQKVILQVEKDHKLIRAYASKNSDWVKSSKTKELAVQNFLKEIIQNNSQNDYYVSWDEKMSVIFPNTLGKGTLLDTTPLAEYKKVLETRESFAITEIKNRIQGKQYRITSIDWEKPRIYGDIIGHKPKTIKIQIDNQVIDLEQIKMVFGTKSGYKVGVIGP
ncbi:hypothetical protein CH354_05705 [Leptospira levettii]|nr:hypothetical protein [Leptospira levettii]PJZ38689.1 hypothetical protein CH354_05705 [Leptospira levettii]PJZ86684.1 hypothetical protein CH368_20775 [Leptospira levettii]PKA02023.1 hypothetical protein CH369_02275 [Leptospira levettii]